MNNELLRTRFAVPIAVAVATHALLFFGFKPARINPPPDEPPGTTLPDKPKVEVVELVEEKPENTGDDNTPSGGNAGETPRSLPEAPPTEPSPGVITVAITETPRGKVTPGINVIPTGPGGLNVGPNTGGTGVSWVRPIDLDEAPRVKFSMRPEYPYSLRTANIEGEVIVDFIVDETGHVTSPRVIRSSNSEFEAAALRAVAKWRFESGKRKGKPVRFRMSLPFVFSINEG